MFNNIKAAIFDLDGTLVDSMGVWLKIDIDYFKEINKPIPENLKDEITHLSFHDTAKYFKTNFNLTESVEEIISKWESMAYDEYKNNIKLKPGAKEFLEKLKKMDIKIGLATSNSTNLLEICLKSNGVYHLFDSITITSETKRDKSFPDVYLLSANKLNVNPEDCIVFEDILIAIRGAKAGGMKVVAVEDTHISSEEKAMLIKESDYYISDYIGLL